MRPGIGRQMDDLLRKRIDDVVSKSSRGSGIAVGEWLDPDVRLPYESAHRSSHGAPCMDRSLDSAGDPLRRGFEDLQQGFRTAGDLNANARPLDGLLREIDRRGNGAADAAIASSEHRWTATPDRALRERGDALSSEREQLFAFVADRWNARLEETRDPLGTSADRPTMSTFERTPLTSPLNYSGGAEAGERPLRSTIESFAGSSPATASPCGQTELPYGARCPDGILDDARDWLRRRSEQQETDRRPAEPLNSITHQLDELAREVRERENGATNDEIEAFKHRLTALARETEMQAERKLSDGKADARGSSRAMLSELGQYRPFETMPDSANLYAQLELRARRDDDWREAADISERSGSPAVPAVQRGTETLESDLSVILNSIALQRQPQPQSQRSDAVRCEPAEPASSKRDGLFATASERWLARPNDARAKPTAAAEHATGAGIDRGMRSIRPAHGARAAKKKPARSTIAPIVRAGLAGVLAIAVVVTGAYFARARMSGPFAAKPTTIVHESAKTGETAAPSQLTIAPPNAVVRFQDLVFQLPSLYGIYAINSGRLFELQALPGQAPDPRIAVSGAIPRPSHTVLPDGRVAFLLFRRDMATNIAERVQIRIIAKLRRPMTSPAAEQRTAGADDAWTIRNIAIDFRVAPVDSNKEMVLLVSEKSDFTFSPGRYALILKGQAYDFTIAGPITDPAQCLERVEAANGGFFHECQSPQVGAAAEPSAQEPLPVSPRSSKLRRQAEMQARR